MRFTKLHSYGNDYLVFEAAELKGVGLSPGFERIGAGVKRYRLRGRSGEGSFRFEAEIGRPRFDSASIPMLTAEPLAEVREYPLALPGGETVRVTALQMCNPNCCA